MATPSYPQPSNAVVVIGPQFCSPYPVDLTVTKRVTSLSGGDFEVTDVNWGVLFKVKGSLLSLRDRRVLVDADGNPLASMHQKTLTAHRRWHVFRGDSSDSKDLLFSVKESSLFQFKTDLDVFLASNSDEDECDFKIKGSYFERSSTILLGNSSVIIAQMHMKQTAESIMLGKDTFGVTAYPNVDYAFIVALIVILEEINKDNKD